MAIHQQRIAWKGMIMGRASPRRSVALIVQSDQNERSLLAALLQETEFETVECESAEAALAVMHIKGDRTTVLDCQFSLSKRFGYRQFRKIGRSPKQLAAASSVHGQAVARVGRIDGCRACPRIDPIDACRPSSFLSWISSRSSPSRGKPLTASLGRLPSW